MGSFSACSWRPSPPASLGLFHQCEDFSFPHQYVLHPASSSFDVYLAIISLPGIFKTGSILIERIFTRWSSSFPTPSTTTWSSPVWWGSSWAVYLHAHGSHPPQAGLGLFHHCEDFYFIINATFIKLVPVIMHSRFVCKF